MPQHKNTITGGDDVGLDSIRTVREGELVCARGVLWPLSGRAAMSDDERRRLRTHGDDPRPAPLSSVEVRMR
jgi:hypothetical protein